MDKNILREELRNSLNEFYHSKVTTSIIEFFQGEGAVLLCLKHAEGPMNPSTISKKVGITRARVANILNALKQKGLISLEQDENDRRKSFVSLTEKGIQEIIEGANAMELYTDNLFLNIGEEKIKTLIDIVKTVNDTFKRWAREKEEADQ